MLNFFYFCRCLFQKILILIINKDESELPTISLKMDVNVQNSLENFYFYANMNIKSTEKLKTYVLCI